MTALLDAAHALTAAGCCVVPTRNDGSKAPAVRWAQYQEHHPTRDQLDTWFSNGHTEGLGVVCGSISGNLELLEIEGRAVHLVADLTTLLTDSGFGDLWHRLCAGYVVRSPSGGMHWLYRVDGPARPNTKLARRPATDTELADHPDEKVKVLIETRGEGGFVVTAPSAGSTHPTGQAWTLIAGAPSTIPTITAEERDALYVFAASFDTMPVIEPEPAAVRLPGDQAFAPGARPGDDYNARATWDDILTPLGWTKTRRFGDGYGWTRPGKKPRDGISATTGTSSDGADRLYVFSTSTEFDTERPYSKFAAHALLEHGGDYSAAAKHLAGQGYGRVAEQTRPLTVVQEPATAAPSSPDTPDQTGQGDPPDEPAKPQLRVVEPDTYTLTDDGNALRLVDTHHDHIRYCAEWGSWLAWDGHRWRRDNQGRVDEYARSIARALPTHDKPHQNHRKWSLSARGLGSMTRVARTDPRITVALGDLDARAYELNTPAGVVDLRTGQLRNPDQTALHTRSTPISPDFDAVPGRWLRFLADTFAGDPDLTRYVQRLLGVSMIGTVLEPVLPFGHGSGANGKSTLLNVAQHALGIGDDGYAMPAPAELLLATAHRGHPTEIARLSGARLVVASELEDNERFAEARIKQLTGKDNLTGRFMGRDFFSFAPTHTIWLLANDQPSVRAGGPAFWRRLRLIPFVHVVPPAERIKGLDDSLIEQEGPAILAWMINGAVDYLSDGLAEPAAVVAATARYEHDQDHLARFVEECCETGDHNALHMTTAVGRLRNRYETWCRTEGETALSSKALTTQLRNRFKVESDRNRDGRYYTGIRVLDDEQNPSHEQPDLSPPADEPPTEWWQR